MSEPVYVDGPFPCLPNKRWRWKAASHLFSADLDALHAMASDIGLRRQWFQGGQKGLPHYDLTQTKRLSAIRSGAVALTRPEAAVKLEEVRAKLGRPSNRRSRRATE